MWTMVEMAELKRLILMSIGGVGFLVVSFYGLVYAMCVLLGVRR